MWIVGEEKHQPCFHVCVVWKDEYFISRLDYDDECQVVALSFDANTWRKTIYNNLLLFIYS